MADKDEKTIDPTSHKLKQAAKDGNLPRSKEFSNIVSFILSFLFLWVFGGIGVKALGDIMAGHLARLADYQVTKQSVSSLLWGLAESAALIVLPFFIFLLIIAIFFSLSFQGGWNFSTKPFKIEGNKFNPMKGLKRILISKSAAMNFLKSILVVSMVTFVAWQSLEEVFPKLYGLQTVPLIQALVFLFDFIFFSILKLCFLFLLLAIIEIAWTKYSFKEKMKMTKNELKDEQKNIEGDPRIKKRIRTVQYQMHRQRMMAAVPEADVVVTNPTHFAVALKYDSEKAVAPQVVAKGQGYLAQKIKSVAMENEVPIYESPSLAQALYKTTEVGDSIPPDLYKAVAEVLAYVYKIKGVKPA
jgi:flagellar biosynthetic protein FlhB